MRRHVAVRVAALLAPLLLASLAGASWVLPIKFVPLIGDDTALLPLYANTSLDGEWARLCWGSGHTCRCTAGASPCNPSTLASTAGTQACS